jgi:DNA-binding transcriptional LysR family regulator
MTMELRQLRYFIAVADELHFGRAAARLNIVQPALSMQIKALEAHLGVELLSRSRQHVALTPIGTAFLQEARRTIVQAEHAEAVGRRAAKGEIGILRIGYIGSAPFSGIMSKAIFSFRQSFPEVEMRLDELSVPDQVRRLKEETLDVGFVRLPLASAVGIRAVVLGRERVIVAVPSSHPLAARSTVASSELRDERLIMAAGQENAGLASLVWRICASGGFEPTITQTVSQIATAVSLVGAGLGIALVPESVAVMRTEAVVYRHLSNIEDMSEIAVVTAAADSTKIALNFLQCAVAVSEGRSPDHPRSL